MITAGEEDAVGVIDHTAAERRAAAQQLYGVKVLKSEYVQALSGKDMKALYLPRRVGLRDTVEASDGADEVGGIGVGEWIGCVALRRRGGGKGFGVSEGKRKM